MRPTFLERIDLPDRSRWLANVQQALTELGVLVGKTTPEDVLEEIFSRFCIGK